MADPINLLVSIDTEEDNWEPAREGITVENIRALPRLDRLFERLGVRATYFCTFPVATTDWSGEILRDLAASGRTEIGAHLHPWNTPPLLSPMTRRLTMMSNLTVEEQIAKLRTLTGALRTATGERPYSFRAGRWAFDGGTANALIECGYRVDSSVTPGRSWFEDDGPSHVGAPLEVYRLDGHGDHRDPATDGTLVEVPLSWGYSNNWWHSTGILHKTLDRSPVARRRLLQLATRTHLLPLSVLSPEICDVDEMELLARRLLDRGLQHLHLSFHSPSLTAGLSPFSRTRADVDRLYDRIERIIERLGALAPLHFATVSETAERLVPRRLTPHGVLTPVIRPQRKVVVLSYHFPPDGAVGGMRWAGLTKYLAAHGWESWVITSAPAADSLTKGVQVVSLPRWPILNDHYRSLRVFVAKALAGKNVPETTMGGRETQPTRVAPGSPPTEPAAPALRLVRKTPPGSVPAVTPPMSMFGRIRYELSVLVGLPDEARGWVLHAAWTSRRLISREHAPIIVSSGPPHSAHVSAWLATRFRSTAWIADLRDPWAGPFSGAWADTPFLKSRLARYTFQFLERIIVRSATLVVCNTQQFANTLSARYPGARIEHVPNAVDRELLPAITETPFDGMGIVHVGTIYGGRDLGPVLEALRALIDREPTVGTDGTRVRIAGNIEEPYATVLRHQIAHLGLTHHVELLGIMSRAMALQLVGRSRLAVVLAQDQALQVPAKLYEMVAMNVPTIVISELDSSTSSEARRLGADAVDPDDVAGLSQTMERLWRAAGAGAIPTSGEVDYEQMARRVSALLATPIARIRPAPIGEELHRPG